MISQADITAALRKIGPVKVSAADGANKYVTWLIKEPGAHVKCAMFCAPLADVYDIDLDHLVDVASNRYENSIQDGSKWTK